MTREEAIKILRSDELRNLADYYSTTQLQDMIDTIVSAPSLPSNLDEAAETYAENILANGEDMFDAIADGFKDGAEWMAGQGETKDGEIIIPFIPDKRIVIAEVQGNYKRGDKVIVQIRKK